MVRYCSVPQCRTYCTEPGISFHFYPTDAERRRVWLIVLRSGKTPSKYAMVCSKHFDDGAFKRSRTRKEGFMRKRLRPDALPTLNLPKRKLDKCKPPRKPPAKRAPVSRQSQRPESIANNVADVPLRRCPCGQVLNTDDASQFPGWEVRREVSIQCGLQQMPPLPLPLDVVPSATTGDSAEEGTDHGTGNAPNHERLFWCHLCKYSAPSLSKLKSHLLSHSTVKPFKCEVCPAAFKNLASYKAHICKHTGETLYQCDLCPYSTGYKSRELEHRRTHLNACTMCAYRTKSESRLCIHQHQHTSNKPFKCKVCSLGFTRKYSLKIHMQRHLESQLS
ncbi:zinc finger and SCAN domain-containing protein 5B [Rhipicephalus sanguineus]|uniref:zinc finger and SCAN domain-containing protein 5B n=1 Tax=Rhipicephalus sanguineus TaxID=34632 RepID=UPI001893EBCD|nr:zinc finger and SCAN domain-containing protein 5B [Rhipicephalus sanguineus]